MLKVQLKYPLTGLATIVAVRLNLRLALSLL